MFTKAYFDTATQLLQQYTGSEPFHLHLKKYYGGLKKFGARDRRQISQLCYSWFRAANGLKHLPFQEQLLYALFLCSTEPNRMLQTFDDVLYKNAANDLTSKIAFVQDRVGFNVSVLFPWRAALSPEIDSDAFCRSFLVQPDVFLRLRPGKETSVKAALQQHEIPFEAVSDRCIAVPNGAKIDAVLQLDRDAVVQDWNSQQVITPLQTHGHLKKFTAWDCCAASGGKSLLLLDSFSNAHITVSDVREAILHNLHKRFRAAEIKKYQWFVGNAATDAPPRHQKFNVVLCDAPCSGSGTWSRTPESLHFFKEEKIVAYAQLQQRILENVHRYVKPGGWLLYSTCSVFAQENEAVAQALVQQASLRLVTSEYFRGYNNKADTLFAALFQAL